MCSVHCEALKQRRPQQVEQEQRVAPRYFRFLRWTQSRNSAHWTESLQARASLTKANRADIARLATSASSEAMKGAQLLSSHAIRPSTARAHANSCSTNKAIKTNHR